MGRRLGTIRVSSVMGESALAPCLAVFAHNLVVGTALKRLDPRARGLLERLDAAAWFAPGATGMYRQSRIAAGVRRHLAAAGSAPREPRAPAAVARNLRTLANLVGLEPRETRVLLFLVALQQSSELRELADALPAKTATARAHVVAAATALERGTVLRAVQRGARLCASGLLEVREDTCDTSDGFSLKDGLSDLLLLPALDAASLLERYFPPDVAPSLGWEDFAHLGDAPELAARLLEAASASQRRGMNILFYGATGTGKTELARLVAQRCGLRLHPAGKSTETGDSAGPRERLSSLMLGHHLLRETRSVLLFDELEDIFQMEWTPHDWPRRFRGQQLSKQWFNELLDSNPVPTVWISNSTGGVDPAFLRRFTYAVEFHPLGARQRERALERHLGPAGGVQPLEVRGLAERYEVSPAQLGTAVGAARLLAGSGSPDRQTLEKLLAPSERLVRGAASLGRPHFDVESFRLDAVNAREDLAALAESLSGWKPDGKPGVSLCLYGPPGTGKSEFAKYLAHRMGRRLVYRRVSDIQSMWVGQTEKNIAAAFREAEQDDAVLLFDEADSFLRDRRGAQRGWEVNEVNEFLQQLERFPGVVACTTNLLRELDEASLRRFVFKVEFLHLRPEQALAMFRALLGPHLAEPLDAAKEREVAAGLAEVGGLTPGDFAAVARRLAALRRRVSAREAVEDLRREVEVKPKVSRAIGIRAVPPDSGAAVPGKTE